MTRYTTAINEPDETKRIDLYKQAQKILSEDAKIHTGYFKIICLQKGFTGS